MEGEREGGVKGWSRGRRNVKETEGRMDVRVERGGVRERGMRAMEVER